MPKVFISYSHDSEAHKESIRQLSERLRNDGIDCTIDQYDPAPDEGWPQWMARHVRDSEYVLLVCTETYQKRVEGWEETGRGLGVRWEGMHILNTIYRNECKNTKFIPVVLDPKDKAFVPNAVFGWTQFDLSQDSEYVSLNKLLWNECSVPKPTLGKKRNFDQRQSSPTNEHGSTILAKIARELSRKRIYDLQHSQVEQFYIQLEALMETKDAGFSNYLWVILYHEFSKRHVPAKSKKDICRTKTVLAMKYKLSDEEIKLVDGINFQTSIKEQLQLRRD